MQSRDPVGLVNELKVLIFYRIFRMLRQCPQALLSHSARHAQSHRYRMKTERDMICVLPSEVKAKNAANGGKSVGKSTESNRNSHTMNLTIQRPDDWHLHVRDGDAMRAIIGHTASQFGRAIIMPNLKPPVTGTDAARAYRQRILDALPADSRLYNE